MGRDLPAAPDPAAAVNRRRAYCWSMIFSENRYPPRIKSGASFFGIMLYTDDTAPIGGPVRAAPKKCSGFTCFSAAWRAIS